MSSLSDRYSQQRSVLVDYISSISQKPELAPACQAEKNDRDLPRPESSTNMKTLAKHPDLGLPSLGMFPNCGKILRQDSNLKSCKDMFQLFLNVTQFRPEEIEVKVDVDLIVVHCKHYELSDEHSWVSREFTRRYKIPADVESSTMRSVMNNGFLVITAFKKITDPSSANVWIIPVEEAI